MTMKTPCMQRPLAIKRQRGISMIEVLVGVLLISVGLLGLVTLQARAIQFSTDSEDTTRAALLANEMASLMWANKSVTVPLAQLTTWKNSLQLANGGLPGGTGDVAIDPTGTVATITVNWMPPNPPKDGAGNKSITNVVIN